MFPPRHNQHVDQKPAQCHRQVDDERIHQELAQVTTDGLRRGRVGRAEIDEKYAGAHLEMHASGAWLMILLRTPDVRMPIAQLQMQHARVFSLNQYDQDNYLPAGCLAGTVAVSSTSFRV